MSVADKAISSHARNLFAGMATLVLLAGCGDGSGGPSVSGSGSENAGSDSGFSSLWEKARSLVVERGKTYEMPALGLMADAFMADYAARGLDLEQVPGYVLQRDRGLIPMFDTAIASMVEPTRQGNATPLLGAIAKVTPFDAEHMVYASPIVIAMQSRKGWEVQAINDRVVDPAFETPFFRANRPKPTYDGDLHMRYMQMLAASAIYTNTVFAIIDKDLGTSRLADPDAAKRQVLETFQAIPAPTLVAALHDAVAQVSIPHFTVDLTGSGNIHFTHNPAGDFVADPRGLTWTKAGGIWFGDGRINGQNVSLRLASTVSLSQRQSQSGNTGSRSSAQVEGAGGVGAGK